MPHMKPNTALLTPTGPRLHSLSSYQHPNGRLTSVLPILSIAVLSPRHPRTTCPSDISRRCLFPSFPTYGILSGPAHFAYHLQPTREVRIIMFLRSTFLGPPFAVSCPRHILHILPNASQALVTHRAFCTTLELPQYIITHTSRARLRPCACCLLALPSPPIS